MTSTVGFVAPIGFPKQATGLDLSCSQGMAEVAGRIQKIAILILSAVICVCVVALIYILRGRAEETPVDRGRNLEKMQDACSGVGEALEAVFKNLQDLRGETGERFKEIFEQFQRKYASWRGDNFYTSCFAEAEGYKSEFDKLLIFSGNSFLFYEGFEVRINERSIIEVKGDGNCLFHTICQGLEMLREELPQLEDQSFNYKDLRALVAKKERELIKKDKRLIPLIGLALDSHLAAKKALLESQGENGGLQQEIKEFEGAFKEMKGVFGEFFHLDFKLQWKEIDWETVDYEVFDSYFSKVEKDGFYSSLPEIYALSKMFPDICFRLYMDNGQNVTEGLYYQDLNLEARCQIGIAVKDSNHYNLHFPPE